MKTKYSCHIKYGTSIWGLKKAKVKTAKIGYSEKCIWSGVRYQVVPLEMLLGVIH